MTRHRTSRPRRLSPRPTPDNRRAAAPPEPEPFDRDRTLNTLRDRVGAADAMVAAADEQIVQLWIDDTQEDILRRRNRVSYYMEAAQHALRDAIAAGQELDLHRRDA